MMKVRSILIAIAAMAVAACASTPDKIVGAPSASPPMLSGVLGGVDGVATAQPLPVAPNASTAQGSFTPGPILARDLVAAAFNLDEAVRIGALPATDPAVECVHDALKQSGLEGGPAAERQSFAPKKDGIVSMGTVLYIMAQQAKASADAARAFELSPACLQIIGRLQVDTLKATAKAGLGILPGVIGGGIHLLRSR